METLQVGQLLFGRRENVVPDVRGVQLHPDSRGCEKALRFAAVLLWENMEWHRMMQDKLQKHYKLQRVFGGHSLSELEQMNLDL